MSAITPSITNDLLHAFQALRASDPELANFYRNQQRFLHLYALARGAELTAARITELVQALDPTRTFGTRTYYQLRRDLEEDGWIEPAEQKPGREENPHRIKPARRAEFLQATIDGSLVDRPVVLNKYRLLDTGLRFAALADNAKADPAALDDVAAALAEIAAEQNGLTFYPGFSLKRFAGVLLELARAGLKPSHAPGTTIDLPGVQWVRGIWQGLAKPPQLQTLQRGALPALGGMRSRGAAVRRDDIPTPTATCLLLRIEDSAAGQPAVSASVAPGQLAGGELRVRWAGADRRLTLGPATTDDGSSRSKGSGSLQTPDDPARALAGLALSLIGPDTPAGLLSAVVELSPSGEGCRITVTSCGTGIEQVKVGCSVGGRSSTMLVPDQASDHWQARLVVHLGNERRSLPFALWITHAAKQGEHAFR